MHSSPSSWTESHAPIKMKHKGINVFVTLFMLAVILSFATVTEGKVIISVYHRSETQEIVWMKSLKEEFEKENPNIEVRLIAGPGGGDSPYFEKLALLWAGGTPPDVFYGSTDKISMIFNGWVRDLTPFIERDLHELQRDDFLPGTWELWKRSGKQMGIPITIQAQGIFYNKQLFDEAGLEYPPIDWDSPKWDWNEMVTCARKLTKLASDGRIVQMGLSGNLFGIDTTWVFGGDWFSEEAYKTGIPSRVQLATPENIRAYQAVVDLYLKHKVCPGPASQWAIEGVIPWNAFMKGKLGMEWVGWWKVRNYVSEASGLNWGIAPYPKVASRKNTIFCDPWFISTATKHPNEAWEFVKFATSKKGLKSFAEIVAFPPSRRSAIDPYLEAVSRATGMKTVDVLRSFTGSISHGRPGLDQSIIRWNDIRQMIDKGFQPMREGKQSVESVLASVEKSVNAWLAQNIKEGIQKPK